MERQSFARASISLVVPRLPSFVRRAGSAIAPFQRPEKAPLSSQPPTLSRSNSSDGRPPSPPPSYSETVSALLTPMKFARGLPGRFTGFAPGETDAAADTISEDPDLIHWKYANQGISLLTLSASESTPAGSSSPFARQLYVHALTYLLRALPSSLSDEEHSSLSAALPPCLAPNPVYACDSIDEFPEYAEDGQGFQQAPPRTFLHRLAAQFIVQAFVLISFLIPWLQYLLGHAFRFNRQHRVTERFFVGTLSTADVLARATAGLFSTIWSLQDGRLARVLESLASWLITSLSAGVYDGVGEGMAVIGLRHPGAGAGPGSDHASHRPQYHSRHSSVASNGMMPPSSPRAPSRARAGSLRVPPAVAGIRARELRKARSHDAMRPAYVGAAGSSSSSSGAAYSTSPAKQRGAGRRNVGPAVARCQGW